MRYVDITFNLYLEKYVYRTFTFYANSFQYKAYINNLNVSLKHSLRFLDFFILHFIESYLVYMYM